MKKKEPITATFPSHSREQLRKAAYMLKAINHNLRIRIMNILKRDKEVTVSKLISELKQEQSVVSQHLAILRRSKFVNTRREGKFINYSLNLEQLNAVNNSDIFNPFVKPFVMSDLSWSQAYQIQLQHIAEWSTKLTPEACSKMIFEVVRINAKGYARPMDVCRGTLITNIVENLK